MVNIYRVEFFALCPANGLRIKYALRIETDRMICVEQLLTAVTRFEKEWHETLADQLLATFGGQQTLIADHHGVTIETIRP